MVSIDDNKLFIVLYLIGVKSTEAAVVFIFIFEFHFKIIY